MTADEPVDDDYPAGENPFGSAYPSAYQQGTGAFGHVSLPPDELEAPAVPEARDDVPAMEPLPDPDALPDPGYPSMAEYPRSAPAASSPFPPRPQDGPTAFPQPPAFPPAPAPSAAAGWPPVSPAASGYRDWPPEDEEQPAVAHGDPYQAPREPAEAPPLRGPAVPLSQVQSDTRPSDAPPLAAPLPEELLPADSPPRETAESLTSDVLLPGKRAAPGVGWRRTIYRASGGLIRVGESAADLRRRDLVGRVRTPVAGGHHRVAVMSLKGGVGKTTATVGLGSTLASLRGDRVIAVDGNPDRGTLSDKVRLETSATIRDLLNERAQVSRYADVRAYTSQASSRLEILASDRDPGVSVAFSADDYRAVARVLEHYYSICLTDCGTGLLHSAMAGILELADQIVLVSSPSVDGARSASATLDWLEAHSYGDLVTNGVVVLSMIRPKSKSTVDLDRLEAHFAARCRAVIRVPYDPHLEEGAEVELDMLNSDTADAYLALAATVGDGFAVPRGQVSWLTSAAPFA
ncbi:MAG TPA: AAA family ATPase [Trebonia sp.]|jgi:MinD-like ATPase involved in chromosome partitioning or flagellar assembly|nr:AAA family ATPase [Trebonia sp.]